MTQNNIAAEEARQFQEEGAPVNETSGLAKFIENNFELTQTDEYDSVYIVNDLKAYDVKKKDIPLTELDRYKWANEFVSNPINTKFLTGLIKDAIDKIYYDCVDSNWRPQT